MSLGSLGWGTVATQTSVPVALLVAAAGILVAIPVTLWARLGGLAQDHSPAHHWPEPGAAPEDQPASIWIAYDVPAEHQEAFLALMQDQRRSRRAHGAYGWVLRQDASRPTRLIESWHEASWLAHLRHHDRVSDVRKLAPERAFR
jgi:hypothetical protein